MLSGSGQGSDHTSLAGSAPVSQTGTNTVAGSQSVFSGSLVAEGKLTVGLDVDRIDDNEAEDRFDEAMAQMIADASSIRTLAAELSEAVEPHGSDADKANAVYTIAECLERKLEELEELL